MATVSADVRMLDAAVEERRLMRAAGWTKDKYFNLFVAEQLLKDLQLSDEELMSGLVDGGNDCGIDALYVLVNGNLVSEGFSYGLVGSQPLINLVLVQAKTSAGFSEAAIFKIASYLPKLLNPDRNEKEVANWCNAELRLASKRFIDAYRILLTKFPSVRLDVYYAARADQAHPNVIAKEGDLAEAWRRRFPSSSASLHCLTAGMLLDWARQQSATAFSLDSAYQPLVTADGKGYVCLVRLPQYKALLSADDGSLHTQLFESNVRDWEGRTDINDQIRQTIESPSGQADFWWLNNGVTILASQVHPHGFSLVLQNPQIVNGLQTSTQVHSADITPDDQRTVLVRVVETVDPETRDRVIRATNSQHELPAIALRATERLQRNIEEYLVSRDVYYERRKNFYKNQGKPISKIVSMSTLAQSVASAVLLLPHISRSAPQSLLEDPLYQQCFGPLMPMETYLHSLALLERVTQALVGHPILEGALADDFRFHLTSVTSILLTRKERPSAQDLAQVDTRRLNQDRLNDVLPLVAQPFLRYRSGQTRLVEELSADARTAEDILSTARGLLRKRNWDSWPEVAVTDEFELHGSNWPQGRRR